MIKGFWTEGDVPTLSVFDQCIWVGHMVFLNAPQTADVILAFKLSSHYPLSSHDYTGIDFSCNIKKTNVKFLERILNWWGTCTPFSVWSMRLFGESHEDFKYMHLKLRKLLCLDELTIRLVATIRWAKLLYRVWFQIKEWKSKDNWNLRHETSIP